MLDSVRVLRRIPGRATSHHDHQRRRISSTRRHATSGDLVTMRPNLRRSFKERSICHWQPAEPSRRPQLVRPPAWRR